MIIIKKIFAPRTLAYWTGAKAQNCKLSSLSHLVELSHEVRAEYYSKHQVLGILYHELYELNSNGRLKLDDYKNIKDVLSKFVDKYKDKFDFPKYPPIETWQEVKQVFERLFEEQRTFPRGEVGNSFATELELISSDGLLKGKPDLIIKNGDDYTIIEYKSGSLYEEDRSLKSVYTDQLQFYSILAFQSLGFFPRKLILKSLVDGTVEVLLDKSRAEYLAASFVKQLSDINRVISDQSIDLVKKIDLLTSPSDESCEYCDLRAFCKKSRPSVIGEGFASSCIGIVERVEITNKHYYGKLHLRTEDNTIVTIMNVPKPGLINMATGSLITLARIKMIAVRLFEFGKVSKVNFYE